MSRKCCWLRLIFQRVSLYFKKLQSCWQHPVFVALCSCWHQNHSFACPIYARYLGKTDCPSIWKYTMNIFFRTDQVTWNETCNCNIIYKLTVRWDVKLLICIENRDIRCAVVLWRKSGVPILSPWRHHFDFPSLLDKIWKLKIGR